MRRTVSAIRFFPVQGGLPVITKAARRWQQSPAPCHNGRMPLTPSKRGLVPPFIAMDVMRAANQAEAAGRRIIHLEVGQPGTQAPAAVREAAQRALAEDRIGYTDALGIAP